MDIDWDKECEEIASKIVTQHDWEWVINESAQKCKCSKDVVEYKYDRWYIKHLADRGIDP